MAAVIALALLISMLCVASSASSGGFLVLAENRTRRPRTRAASAKKPPAARDLGTRTGDIDISEAEFNRIQPNLDTNVPAQFRPYFSYANFVEAAKGFPDFASTSSRVTNRQILASFFANMMQETGMNVASEYACQNQLCMSYGGDLAPGCGNAPRCAYFGRGPLQLTWKGNYANASKVIFGDENVLLKDPWLVEQDGVLGFKCAIWFFTMEPGVNWNFDGRTMQQCMLDGSFECSLRSINGALECKGAAGYDERAQNRVKEYRRICAILGVEPGTITGRC